MDPLLPEMSVESDSPFWWLLDTGAAATVMPKTHASSYDARLSPVDQDENRFRAADGSRVEISGCAHVPVWVGFDDGNHCQANLRCLVGNISRNILSTTALCSYGWEVVQDSNGCYVKHVSSGKQVGEVGFFGGCPWLHLEPVVDSSWNSQTTTATPVCAKGASCFCVVFYAFGACSGERAREASRAGTRPV